MTRARHWLLARLGTLALLAGLGWGTVHSAAAADDYKLEGDSLVQEGVPQGTVTKLQWKESKVFPGTERDWWLYVPKQYDGSKPAAVMIFQDGGSYVDPNGQFRTTVVFDNLIHKKQMPVTIGIFISPGVLPAPTATAQGR